MMRAINTFINIGRIAYKYKAFRYPFNSVARLCSKIAAYEKEKGKPLLPKYRHGHLRLTLSKNPFWNNSLMQTFYREFPRSKMTLGIMKLLVTTEPIKDRMFRKISRIRPNSPEEQEIITELDRLVSSMETYAVDGITSFKGLFEGKFTQHKGKSTSGFEQFMAPLVMAFHSSFIREKMPGFYEEQMRITAMAFKVVEVLSRKRSRNERGEG